MDFQVLVTELANEGQMVLSVVIGVLSVQCLDRNVFNKGRYDE